MLRQPGAAALPWAAASLGAARQSRLARPLAGASPAVARQGKRLEAGQSPARARSPSLAAAASLLDLRKQIKAQVLRCKHHVRTYLFCPCNHAYRPETYLEQLNAPHGCENKLRAVITTSLNEG